LWRAKVGEREGAKSASKKKAFFAIKIATNSVYTI
jgi:hypothetical protein